ncbi:DUF5134 domain-containing protein [Streptomyces sp. TS71-3]|nr:DUF5134 domain-containing protein [Streptomyces sp. TS71-3]
MCAASGAYCLLRMRGAVGAERHAAGADALMGLGTAAMAVPAAVLTPPRAAWLACAAVFGAAALHAAWTARQDRGHLHHLVCSGAMVYMSLAMAAMPAMDGGMVHSTAGVSAVTGPLLLYFAGYALWGGIRLVPSAAPEPAGPGLRTPAVAVARWTDRPELARACRIGMSIGMLAMLLAL